jgi:hypothetical protein
VRRFQIYILLVLVLFASNSDAQWYKLQTFDMPISCVAFLDEIGSPLVGFAGLNPQEPSDDLTKMVRKTTDGGISWLNCHLTGMPSGAITNFCFMNDNVGWLSLGHTVTGSTTISSYMTTDGGSNWIPMTIGSVVNGSTSVYYNSNTNLLFLSSWSSPLMVSSDLGFTWNQIPHVNITNGFAFSNQNEGVLSRVSNAGITFYDLYRTTDGGLTWNTVPFKEEAWQPLAIPNSSIYFLLSELSGNLYRSDDGGIAWNLISTVPTASGQITGSLSMLFIQTSELGILQSTDQGRSWKSICGPHFFPDTRFDVIGRTTYAFDKYFEPTGLSRFFGRLWVNTTGNGSGERLLLSHTSGNRDFVLRAGDNCKADIALPDTFSTIQWLKLDSLVFTVKYEADVLSLKSAEAAQGWKLISATESLGKVSVKLLRESSNDRGVPVASLTFQASIAREKETDVYIDSVFYNAGEFTNCEVLASEKLHVTISDECGDSTLRAFLNSKPILEIVSIYPNPTNGDITIDFRTLVDGDVSLEVYDNNVRGLIRKTISAKAGVTSVPIDLSQFFGGTFFVQLSIGKDVVTGRFVKQ